MRKVPGAGVGSIAGLLLRNFLKPVGMAILVASPIAWYAMSEWLQNFAYRVAMSWWIFAGTGVLAIGTALLTVSFQSIRIPSNHYDQNRNRLPGTRPAQSIRATNP